MKGINNFRSLTVVLVLIFSLLLGGVSFTLNSNANEIPVWDPDTVYHGGDLVFWNGKIWQAQWWTLGEEPGTTGEWGVWRLYEGQPTPTPSPSPTPEPTPPAGLREWDPNTVYVKGDLVHWKGYIWEAQWWTLGEEPARVCFRQ